MNWQDDLLHILSSKVLSSNIENGELTIHLPADELIYVCRYLKTKLDFSILVDITALHYPNANNEFVVVYHFLNISENQRLRLKVGLNDTLEIPSLVAIFSAANWYEREVFDMFGLTFTKHPYLERILTDDGFEGFPLRKDFPVFGKKDVFFNEKTHQVEYGEIDMPEPTRFYEFDNPWRPLPGDEKAVDKTDE